MDYKPKLQIPLGLGRYIIVNRLEKVFQVYIQLLATTDGFTNEGADPIKLLATCLCRDLRTVRKALSILIKLNWVGHDIKTGNYYVRSLKNVSDMLKLPVKKAGTFYTKDILQLKAFLVAAVISEKINCRRAAKLFAGRRARSATVYKDVAQQGWAGSSYNTHCGMSLKEIAEIFECSHGKACNLKMLAKKAGFIIATNKFKLIMEFPKCDFRLRAQIKDNNKNQGCKLLFKALNGTVQVYEQLMDEIIPHVRLIKIRARIHITV